MAETPRRRRTVDSQPLIPAADLPWHRPATYRDDRAQRTHDRIPSTLVDELWELAEHSGITLSQVIAMLCHNTLPESLDEADAMIAKWRAIKMPETRRRRP